MELKFDDMKRLSDPVIADSFSGRVDYWLYVFKRGLEDAAIFNSGAIVERRAEIGGFLQCLCLFNMISYNQAADYMAEIDKLIANAKH